MGSMASETANPVFTKGRGTVVAAIVYFFCVICSYYVIKPIRGSLVLELGSEAVPVLNILSMASLIAANALYSYIVGRYKRDIFIPVITKFFVLCLIGFWVIFSFVYPISGAGINKDPNSSMPIYQVLSISFYYLWVNFFSLIAVSMFWSFMNDVFSVSQGRRLYAIIGYGGLIGGLAGSALTSGLAKVIGTNNLFLLAIALLYPSIWCMEYIEARHDPNQIRDENNVLRRPEHPPRPWDGFMSVCANPILICMAFEMLLYTFSSTIFFQQMNRLVETSFSGDERTRFIAGLYGRINFTSLITQFFLTKLFMLLKNPIYGLLSMTIIQIAGTIITFSAPSLTIISWVIVIRYAINYSTGRALRELVFIPLSHEEKYQGKGFIDTVVFRVGDGLSSLTLIGGLRFYGYGSWLNHIILISMLLQWVFITRAASIFASKSASKKDSVNLKTALASDA